MSTVNARTAARAVSGQFTPLSPGGGFGVVP